MLKNYIKIAFRNLLKNKTYSAINIFGLSIGVACCFMILLYLTNEFSYDKFHENSDRIYRAWIYEDFGDGDIYFDAVTPIGLKPTLEENIPEVEMVTRRYLYETQLRVEKQSIDFAESVSFVDPQFFSMFDFKLSQGFSESVFSQPSSVVLTEAFATKFFGKENPLQKSLLIKLDDTFESFTVTGIISNAPSNSTIDYDILIPFENARKIFSERAWDSWQAIIPETYIQLSENSDIAQIDRSLQSMAQSVLGERWDESKYTIGLQPISDIHLNPEVPASIHTPVNPVFLYMLAGIAFLVLLIACVNFITISISRSTSRAKEVGVRKAIGAERASLMYQFWGEALIMTILSLLVGLFLTEIFLPYFNNLSGSILSLKITKSTILLIIGLTVFISIVAGIYPALILSKFRPIEALKGKIQMRKNNSWFRTGMVVFQFTISIFLVASTTIILDQLSYMRSADLGFQKEHIVVIELNDTRDRETGFGGLMERAQQKLDIFESQLTSIPEVQDVAMSLYTPIDPSWMYADYRDTDNKLRVFNLNMIDAGYAQLMGFEFITGRSFSEENGADASQGIIVNQALVDDYGWTDPLNEAFPSNEFETHQIIGVVENFNYSSLHKEVEPLAIVIKPATIFSGIQGLGISSQTPKISIKIDSKNVPATIAKIKDVWSQISPGEPFSFTFLDEAIDSQYHQEEQLSQIVTFGAIFTILIACLGLFGLVSLTVVRRTKEIGIRKVLGSSSQRIVLLVNKEFTQLLLIAIALSAPLIWFGMNYWLNNFAYRINIDIFYFLYAGGFTLIIAWLSIGYQAYKATTINPVESLKGE